MKSCDLKVILSLLLLVLIDFEVEKVASQVINCQKRQYSGVGDSFVCVCNSTFCDTIDSVDGDNKDKVYQEFITDRHNFRLSKTKKDFEIVPTNDSFILKVKRSEKYQKIFGFGGAITDSAGYNIYSLNENARSNLIKSYFDPKLGHSLKNSKNFIDH
jgi:glucosylceramidase